MFTGTPTPHLGLPQYSPKDNPDFLTDINYAFKKIDGYTAELDTQLSQLQNRMNYFEEFMKQLRIECGLTSAERED